VNSEELEQSLRTEFESYLKNVLADMRQEVSEFQKQFEAEFEKHKAQLDEVFQSFSARLASDRELDSSFTESVVEHLRLSRDEGASITAMAIAEAEELEKQNAAEAAEEAVPPAPPVSFSEIRDAINDISTKTTQSAILKTLVNHAAQFTPRGAFFIIKNEHLVGWRVFGRNGETVDEQTVREVFFPVASGTVLGEAVRSLSAVESAYGVYSDDSIYLNKLEFGQPEQMFAVPLVVRGRSVAVLYADPGNDGEEVNIEALETLVRVASMTVEILASARGAQNQAETAEETTAARSEGFEEPARQEEIPEESVETVAETAPAAEEYYRFAETESPAETAQAESAATEEPVETPFSYTSPVGEDYSYQPVEQPVESADYQTSFESDRFAFKPNVEPEDVPAEFVSETEDEPVAEISTTETLEDYQASLEEPQTFEQSPAFESQPVWNQTVETEDFYSKDPAVSYESPAFEAPESYEISEPPQTFETEPAAGENEYAPSLSGSDYQFETNQSFETPQAEFESTPPAFETPAYEAENFAPGNGVAYDTSVTENGRAEAFSPEVPVETVSESVVKQPAKSRFSERNVDLPIEVSEDERRLHNDARRFARLLVSEIKLYNEQKVKEGRESNDLYERLREAIDRSREMYDKRVQPPVASKFDYFHYELVSNLAEGDEGRLGTSYPGANV
jgi:hypothetical protein